MSLAGHFTVYPGQQPSIQGQRPVLGAGHLGRLLRGQTGDAAVNLLGHVLALCAHAQRRTARLAMCAAQQQAPLAQDVQPAVLLRLETARDHLRSMAMDWPQRLSSQSVAANLQWLARCPLPLLTPRQTPEPEQAAAQLTQLHDWLTQQTESIPPLQCLAQWHASASSLQPTSRTLDVLDADKTRQTAHLQALAHAMRANPDFVQRPQWQGACAETGVWTRLRGRSQSAANASVLTRLQARWTELLALAAAPTDDTLLDSGALPLGEGQAIAWCEMARGLLLHWVQLDGHNRVQDYRVLAPTEWNFHPQGALANALSQLAPQDSASAWCLTAAFDPCVACSVETVQKENTGA